MQASPFLPDDLFAGVVRHAPLVSIDLVVRSPDGRALLGLRNNEPAKGVYFVPGGCIRKNETLRAAFSRILSVETGLAIAFEQASLLGVYEHFYAANRFGDPDYGTHYVVIAYQATLTTSQATSPDAQHSVLEWFTPESILAMPNVHANAKAYFRHR